MIVFHDQEIHLLNFPMPVTANRQHGYFRGRFIKSKEARTFDHEVLLYKNSFHLEAIRAYKQLFVGVELNDYCIQADTDFIFPYSKLFTKQNRPKVIDANNRIKATLDGVSFVIGVDDKHIFEGHYRKLSCDTLKDPIVNIRLSLKKLNEFRHYKLHPEKLTG